MVIDTSALIAILLQEADARSLALAIEAGETRLMSAANLLEAQIVIESKLGERGAAELDLLVGTARIEVVDVTAEQIAFARHAWRQFGKGRHVARLNFGDCFAYALARATGERLLCKGDDFVRTDVALVGI